MTYKLPEGWKEVKLSKIGKIVTGKTPSTKDKENFNGDIPFLTPSDNMESRFVISTDRTLSKKGVDNVKNQLIPKNSICVSCIGSQLGKVTITQENTVTNQQINSIVVNENIDNMFVYYAMLLVGEKLKYISKTSTAVPIVNKTNFSKEKILLPALLEQKTVADTLSALDDKIENNNKLNENLEQQAQAIFKHWFIDFEFPDENGNPYKSSGGEMVESELGMIPKGWEVGKLDDVIELHDSKRIPLSKKQRDIMEKNYPYYGATSVIDYVEDYIFDGTYLLLGEDGSVSDDAGYPILQYVWGKIWVNNHAHVMTGKGVNTVEYLYMLLKNTNVNNIITGAVQKKINQRNLKSLEIIISEEELLLDYIKIIKPIFKKRKLLETQNQKLSQLRDTLLPKLMSGELRIPLD